MGARDCTGAIDTCLANRSRAETFRLGISLFLLLVLIDIGVNVLLREAPVLIAPPNVSLWWETDYDIRGTKVGMVSYVPPAWLSEYTV